MFHSSAKVMSFKLAIARYAAADSLATIRQLGYACWWTQSPCWLCGISASRFHNAGLQKPPLSLGRDGRKPETLQSLQLVTTRKQIAGCPGASLSAPLGAGALGTLISLPSPLPDLHYPDRNLVSRWKKAVCGV